jgi:thymidylate kinase
VLKKNRNCVIICDRWSVSGLAYGVYNGYPIVDNIDRELLLTKPDLYIYLRSSTSDTSQCEIEAQLSDMDRRHHTAEAKRSVMQTMDELFSYPEFSPNVIINVDIQHPEASAERTFQLSVAAIQGLVSQ